MSPAITPAASRRDRGSWWDERRFREHSYEARKQQVSRRGVGFDTQGDANDWNDRALFNGVVAARNSLRQPSFFDLDIRLVKDITLRGEGHHLDLFMDIFNITNASNRNFGPESISVFGTPSAPIYSAGQALFAPDTNQLGSARQVQFTARITAF